MELDTVLDLLTRSDFRVGLGYGVLGLAVLLVASLIVKGARIWGVVLAAAAIGAIFTEIGQERKLALGVALLALVEFAWKRWRVAGWVFSVVGAAAVTLQTSISAWVAVGSLVFILAGGYLIGAMEKHTGRSGVNVIMIAITIFGVWATVPDTEHARLLLGVSVGMLVGVWPLRRDRIGYAGGFVVAALVAWVAATSGESRPGSIVGSWACLGAIAAVALAERIARRPVALHPAALVVIHGLLVFVASRVAGFRQGAIAAGVIAAAALAVATAWLAARARRTGDPASAPRFG